MITNLKRHELTLHSNPANIVEVEPFVEAVRQELEIPDELFGNILVALTEGVNNAINHGNSADDSKMVHVKAAVEGKTLSFTINDEGPGFDYNNLPDPTSPENIEKPTGRGVFLMKQLSDMVIFDDTGSTVEIQFKL